MRLTVPHIQQEQQMSCWHAAARMLYAYRNMACINPLPDRYDANQGIGAQEFIDLATDVGLETMPTVNQCFGWQFLDYTLRRFGPVWAAGQWNGVNHIVVITGVESNGTIYVNDPAFPTPVTRDIQWFNDRIDKTVTIPMMYLP